MLVHFRQPPPQLSSSSLHGERAKLVSFANPTNPSRAVLSFATHNLHLLHPPKPYKTPRPPLVLASSSGSTPTNTPTAKRTILRPRKADTTPEDTTTTTTTTTRGSTVDDSPRRRFEQSSGSPRDGREKKKRKPDGDRKDAFVEAEEDRDRLLDAAEFDLGVSASEYFEKHAIRNVEVDGVEIDWEGEMDNAYVQEINCLEWESFAFHPSPLMVLVFERYNRAADNWMLVKELEKAAKVYLDSRNLLPPRMAKIDINIETDLAYALKVRQCPQLLFLRGDKILYREKELRTADELVQMIAYFYYNAKKPSWVVEASIRHPY